MIKGLVSIISPCYNGEKYVKRFLESVLVQTYNNIELIMVNDGSIDGTEKIIKSYIDKFKESNIKFYYIYQNNQGQAESINKGLKIFNGEFLTWPDSDDVLHPDSIKEKVEFLIKHPDYGLVRTTANIIDEESGKIIGNLKPKKNKVKENLFEDLIFENDVWFAPGCYMVRTKAFLDSNPNCKIYNSRGGQNWQMLLPITYKYKCGFISKNLYDYYIRKDSHSHQGIENKKIQLEKIEEYRNILTTVLNEMGLLEKYKEKLDLKYSKKKFKIAFKFKDINLLKKEYSNLKKKFALDNKIRLMYIIRKK